MKKIFLFSIFAASLFVASCESEFDPTVLGGVILKEISMFRSLQKAL